MICVSKVLFVSAASVVLGGGLALADSHTAGGNGDGSSGDDAAPISPDSGDAIDAAPSRDSWPMTEMDRPLTAARGMTEVTPMVTFDHTSAGTDSASTEGASVAVRHGLGDQLELAAAYSGIRFNPDSTVKGALTAGVGYRAIQGGAGGKLDVAPRAALVYDFAGETAHVLVGADVRYKLGPRMFVGTPSGVPGLSVTVKGADVMGTSVHPITLAIPFAFGLQITPVLQVQGATTVASISLKDSATTYISDVTPLAIDAIYALSGKMDVRVDLILADLQHAGDGLGLAAGINLRM